MKRRRYWKFRYGCCMTQRRYLSSHEPCHHSLNIISPGGFPNGVTLQEVFKGRSEIRNKVVARVFKALGYIEQWGGGVPRIREVCRQAGNLEPRLEESGDFVDWLFFRSGESDHAHIGSQARGDERNAIIHCDCLNSVDALGWFRYEDHQN